MKRAISVLAAVGVTAALAGPIQAASAQALPDSPLGSSSSIIAGYAFQGSAYGTRAVVVHRVTSGNSAPVVLSCTVAAGEHKTNQAAGVNAPPLVSSGTVKTTADTGSSPVQATTSASVQSLNLLSGIITASVVRSVSSTSHRSAGFHVSAAGTSFTGLQVAGVPITGAVDPNTRIDVVGFGYVVLNEQSRHVSGRSASLTVNAVHLVVDESNVLGIPAGTEVTVAHAFSGLDGPAAATVDGFAYGSRAKAGHLLSSGPSFKVILPCLGTNGRVKVNEGAGVTIEGVLRTGAIRNTAEGDVDAAGGTVETTSTVDDANLLAGLLQATTIKADAHAATDGGSATFSDAGSSFATLSVAGFPEIGPNVDANTKLRIRGLGTLWLHRIVSTPTSIETRMIELVVTQDNGSGLPVGADIRIAVAHSSVHSG